MNLQQLQYFLKIIETGNFTKAAMEMNVTQPALSKAVSKLEEELNVPLFQRSARGIICTEYGTKFAGYAEKALAELHQGFEELARLKKTGEQALSVSATYCIGTYFMPYLISQFLAEHPYIRFQFYSQKANDIFDALERREIDFGFFDEREAPDMGRGIQSIPIQKEKYLLIVPKSHPLAAKEEVSIEDLKEEYCIVCNDTKENHKIPFTEFLGSSKKIMVHPEQIHMLGGLVAANVGIAVVADTPMINETKVTKVKIKEDIGYKVIHMGWLRDHKPSVQALSFMEYVKNTWSL